MGILLILFLGVLVQSVNALSCTSCDKTRCVQPVNCKGGLVKGICGCCDVCAKTNGERCGGSWNMYGLCAKGLKCVARSNMEKENAFLPKHFHTGVCESDACENKRCGFRETCKTNKRGQPVCVCPRKCGKVRRPVCGLSNGKQYRNRCKLTREECLTKKEIGMVHGSCKQCSFQGRQYKFGAARPDATPCETCICRHGSWECQIKSNCSVNNLSNNLNKRPSCLMSSDGEHIVLPCPMDFSCRIPRSDEKPHLVRVGMCKKKIDKKPTEKPILLEIYNGVDIFIRKGNEGRTRMTDIGPEPPVFSMLLPKENTDLLPTMQQPEESFKTHQHGGIGLIQRVCMVQPDKSTCRPSSLTRWFYNATSKTCEKFQYGGCGGNFNNFVSKEKCHEVCYSGVRHEPTSPVELHTTTNFSSKPDNLLEMCHDIKSGKSYRDGEKWNIDECTSCSCVSGRTRCMAETCHTTCSNPTYLKGICCPKCDKQKSYSEKTVEKNKTRCKDTTTGLFYHSGENWKNGECVDCVCFEGYISCMRSACSIPYCDNPVKQDGECCPTCPGNEGQVTPTTPGVTCRDNESGEFYKPGEGWKVNDCTSCFCGNNGKSVCHELTCITPTCNNPVHLQGRCCPVCPDSFLSVCRYDDHVYFKGDLTLLGDMCTLCRCNGNEWRCSDKHCNKTKNGIGSPKVLNTAKLRPSVTESLELDRPTTSNENHEFVMEDPIRMLRRENTMTSFDVKPTAVSSSKEFLRTLIQKAPTTKSDQSEGYVLTDKAKQTEETSKSDYGPRNEEQTNVPRVPLLKSYSDFDTGPVGKSNNHTVVYLRKRL